MCWTKIFVVESYVFHPFGVRRVLRSLGLPWRLLNSCWRIVEVLRVPELCTVAIAINESQMRVHSVYPIDFSHSPASPQLLLSPFATL